eukprot:scaffold103468_cov34-Prasinocladus_malaysianus.AAC.1
MHQLRTKAIWQSKRKTSLCPIQTTTSRREAETNISLRLNVAEERSERLRTWKRQEAQRLRGGPPGGPGGTQVPSLGQCAIKPYFDPLNA